MGNKIDYIGEIGYALKLKLLLNANLGVYMTILSETIRIAEKLGISREKFLLILNTGNLATAISRGKAENIIKENYPVNFPYEHMLKDLSY